jgi:hypothetical protein
VAEPVERLEGAGELLEGTYMKHIMYTSLRGKLQTHSHIVDDLADAVGPDVARL